MAFPLNNVFEAPKYLQISESQKISVNVYWVCGYVKKKLNIT